MYNVEALMDIGAPTIYLQEAHQKSIQREQQRANEAEERLKKQSLVRKNAYFRTSLSDVTTP